MTTILAYSYDRFSSPEQGKGDSIRRQVELRDAFLAETGAVLDTSVTLRDEGVSAFTGEHRSNPDRHALAAFLSLVDRGRVPRGSYLIVESLDRLTREDIRPAMTLLFRLIETGVRVVQLLPVRAIYDEKTEPMGLMMAMMELTRANSESKMKSERVGRAWGEKRKKATADRKPMTARLPAWMRMEKGEIVLDQVKADVVRRLFRLAIDGHGLGSITKLLNSEGVPPIARATYWARSYVVKLLGNRATLGEYQPFTGRGTKRKPTGQPIPDFYPAVIDEATWHAAQGAIASRKGTGSGGGKEVNVFGGLLIDARDGGSIAKVSKGKKGNLCLVSYLATQGKKGSQYVSFPLRVFEAAVLGRLREIDPREILPPEDGKADAVLTLAGQLEGLEARIQTLTALVGKNPESESLVAALLAAEAERNVVRASLTEAQRKQASPLGQAWGETTGLLAVLESAPDQVGARTRLRGLLRRVVKRFVCLFVANGAARIAAVQACFQGGGVRDFLILHRPAWGGATGEGRRAAEWFVRSVPHTGDSPLDLSDPKQAKQLAEVLESIPLDRLSRLESAQRPSVN